MTTMHDELRSIKRRMKESESKGKTFADRSYFLGCLHVLHSLSEECAPDVRRECRVMIDKIVGVNQPI